MIETERKKKDELAKQRMAEQEEKQKQRKLSIQRQESLLKEEHKQKELKMQKQKEEEKKYVDYRFKNLFNFFFQTFFETIALIGRLL